MRGKDTHEPASDPAADDVVEAYELGHRRYGARTKKAARARKSITLDRRRTARVMKEKGLTSAYAKTGFKCFRQDRSFMGGTQNFQAWHCKFSCSARHAA